MDRNAIYVKTGSVPFRIDVNDILIHGNPYLRKYERVKVTVSANQGDMLPAGLLSGTYYYVIKITDITCKLATSYANAIDGLNIAIIAGTGQGVFNITDYPIGGSEESYYGDMFASNLYQDGKKVATENHIHAAVRTIMDPYEILAKLLEVSDPEHIDIDSTNLLRIKFPTSEDLADTNINAHLEAFNHSAITYGMTAYNWGDHSLAGYIGPNNPEFTGVVKFDHFSEKTVGHKLFADVDIYSAGDIVAYVENGATPPSLWDALPVRYSVAYSGASGFLQLVNDANAPGINKMYGTDAAGAKGWYNVPSSGGGGTWGSITGTLSAQTDLNTALGLKAPLASPSFTGTLALPAVGTNDISSGTGDGATFATYNFKISGWNGMAMYNPTGGGYPNQITGVYDFRFGSWDTLSYPKVAGTAINSIFAPIANPRFTGTVGVGTSAPDFLLTVGDDATAATIIASINGPENQQKGLALTSVGVTKWYMYNPASSSDLRWFQGSYDRMKLTTAGDLYVAGDIIAYSIL